MLGLSEPTQQGEAKKKKKEEEEESALDWVLEFSEFY